MNKPTNKQVLIDGAGAPKIADFGMSRETTRVGTAVEEMTANVGTPVYMAPELMADSRDAEVAGPLLDVYSFGVMTWAVMARAKPYRKLCEERRLNMWSLRDMIVAGTRPAIDGSAALQSAPTSAVRLMERCWAATPSERPSGFDEIQHRLQQIVRLLDDSDGDSSGSSGSSGNARPTSVWRAARTSEAAFHELNLDEQGPTMTQNPMTENM